MSQRLQGTTPHGFDWTCDLIDGFHFTVAHGCLIVQESVYVPRLTHDEVQEKVEELAVRLAELILLPG